MVLDTANGLAFSTEVLDSGPGKQAWAILNSLPPGKQASKASQIDACLLTSNSRKERGLIDSPRMTYITRQSSGEEYIFQWKRMSLFQEDNVRPYTSHIGDGYHGMPTHVAAHIHQRQLGLLLFPIKKETVPAWQLSIINFIFLLE